MNRKYVRKYVIGLVVFVSAIAVGAETRLIDLRARKFSYTPNIIRVNKADKVKIRLFSEDVQHGFFLDGYGVQTTASPGQHGTVDFVADKTGKFTYRCSVTCGEFHPYMVGYMIVSPNTRLYFFAGLVVLIGVASLLFISFSIKRELEHGQG